jgi:hypothetical protein
MARVTILSSIVQPWPHSTSGTVELRWRLDRDGIDGDGNPQVRESGPVVTCTVAAGDVPGTYKLTIPDVEIQPTDNWKRPRNAKYTAVFVLPGGKEINWEPFTNVTIPAAFPNNGDPLEGTYDDLAQFQQGHRIVTQRAETFTKQEIWALIAGITIPTSGAANTVYATPNGMGGAPSLRALVAADLPAHTHATGDVTGLAAAIDARITNAAVLAAIGFTPANAVHTHVAAGITDFAAAVAIVGDALYAELVHTHVVGDVTGFAGAVDARITNAAVLAAIGFTPEDSANKDQASGYAGLTAGGKVAAAQLTEVLAIGELTNVDTTGLATHQLLAYDGADFTPRGGMPNALAATNLLTAGLYHDHTPASDFAYAAAAYPTDHRDFWYWLNYMPGPGKIGFATRGIYADVGAGGNFQLVSYVENTGTRNAVALACMAIQRAAGTVWAFNPIGFVDVNGAVVATAIANETNFGSLGTSTNAVAIGEAIYSVANANTVLGSCRTYTQYAVSKVADAHIDDARCLDGIVFMSTYKDDMVTPVSPLVRTVAYGGTASDTLNALGTGAVLKASGIEANFLINAADSQWGYGIDFAGSTFAHAPMRLPYTTGLLDGLANSTGIGSADKDNTTFLNLIRLGIPVGAVDNTLVIGSARNVGGVGVKGISFNVQDAINPVQFKAAVETVTLSLGGVTTDSAANLLPANAVILSVSSYVVQAPDGPLTQYSVGDAANPARFISNSTAILVDQGAVGLRHWRPTAATDAEGPFQTTAAPVRITADAAPTSTGQIKVVVSYLQFRSVG